MSLIFAANFVQFAVLVLFVSVFVTLAGWAIWAGLNVLGKRRDFEQRREELASDVLKSMRDKAVEVPATKKPLVYLPDTMAEEPAKVDPPKNPWFLMLVQPTATIRQIVDFDPQLYVLLLSCLYGGNALLVKIIGNPRLHLKYEVLLPVVLVGGPLYGLIGISLMSWTVRTAARYLGGEASEHETQAAVAWSTLPLIYITPLTFASAMLLFTEPRAAQTSSARALLIAYFVAAIVSSLWTFALWLNSLAEVNQFSRWKALSALLLSALILVLLCAAFCIPFVVMYLVLGLSPLMFAIAFIVLIASVFLYTKLSAT